MDFTNEVCWFDLRKNIGIDYEALDIAQHQCFEGKGPCYFLINSEDLERMLRKLHQGR